MLPYLIEIVINRSITTTRLNEKYFILENNPLDSTLSNELHLARNQSFAYQEDLSQKISRNTG